ncbi:two-component system response regulator [Cellvibrio sp. OA-2007]|uniref:two-component system response regulator n=1 Tax=Cellvibrio sp. OA-2007 TaxID=529823 RepID=UPI000781B247|nr:EAL domain-containing protein [Cellvibrio sp. OA-2007]
MIINTKNKKTIKLLLVEDDDVDQEKITNLLLKSPASINIVTATSAEKTEQLITQHNFDFVILDYHLQDTSSSEIIEKIRNHKNTPTPIIMISGNDNERVIANVMREGVFDYLPKRGLNAQQLIQSLDDGLLWAESEQTIKENRTRLNQLAEGLPQLAWTCLPNGDCDFLNRRWCDYTGIGLEEQLGNGWLNQIHPDDREQLTQSWKKAVRTGEEMYIVFRIRRHDGEYRWFDSRAVPQKNDRNEIVRWLGSNTDINDIEITRQALANSEQLFRAAFNYAPLGMMIVTLDGTIMQANPALYQLLGHPNSSSITSLPGFLSLIHPDDLDNTEFQMKKNRLDKDSFIQYETRFIAKDGHAVPVLISLAFIKKIDSEPCHLLQVYDLSERKRYESQLIKLAHYDSLTGLGNRAKLQEEITHLIQKSRRSSSPFGVLFGDIDHFKNINDSLGHEAGDQLLRTIARRLQRSLRIEDNICRLGGDEFVVLLQDINKFESVVTVAEKLLKKINKPIRLGSNKIHIGMSFGIALYPTDGDDAKTLLRNADSALYDAKAKGRGCYQLYRKELTEYVHGRLRLDNDLRKAITNHEFELHYQPIVNLKTQKVVSAEALLRWHHPTRGTISPDEFIPYAQESGLIVPIGDWVIQQACAQASQWHAAGFPIAVSINVSARQFEQENLTNIFMQALSKNQFSARYLIVEITEQMFLQNTEHNLKHISELKQIGIKISLDDFGVGYSSLSYIVRFAPHYLKIDRSFINRIGTAKEHDEMVNAIIGLSNIIPMQIVGEGIEEISQQIFLSARNCDLGQGYLFSHPLSHSDLLTFLRTHY